MRRSTVFAGMNKEDKLIHVELLEDLLNKQRVLYTRMSLSDDPDYVMMKKNIVQQTQMLGFLLTQTSPMSSVI